MLKKDCPAVNSGDAVPFASAAVASVSTFLLAQARPPHVWEAVEKAAVAVSHRQGKWGVDGAWSYEFSKLGYAGAATSHSGATPQVGVGSDGGTNDNHDGPDNNSSVKRRDVLKDSFDRVLRSRGSGTTFRVLDLGSGGGDWLLQARRQLEEKHIRESLTVYIHGVTGDALPSGVGAKIPSKMKKGVSVEVAHFQQIGIETFPLLLGEDTFSGSEEQRIDFKQTVEKVILGGDLQKRTYDLIVSSWTFCHLIDPLATLELWSNALAVEGELYVNDIDFSVLFDGEHTVADLASTQNRRENALKDSAGVARPEDHHSKSAREARSFNSNQDACWESDPETRMERAFAAVKRQGEIDHTFSIEFVFDDEDYRTAVKVRRMSAAPIRFAPVVGYTYLDNVDGDKTLLDSSGRPVYKILLQRGVD